jgi:hypothetical protein
MVAAGLAQTRNARAGGIRGGLVPAAACGSQNPPRCRVSGTAGIPVIHGRQDVKAFGSSIIGKVSMPCMPFRCRSVVAGWVHNEL